VKRFLTATSRHLTFSKVRIFSGQWGLQGHAVTVKKFTKIIQSIVVMLGFRVFQDGGRRHLGFWKFKFLNGLDG